MAQKHKFLHLNTKSDVIQTVEGSLMTVHSCLPVVQVWEDSGPVRELIAVFHLQPGDTVTKED